MKTIKIPSSKELPSLLAKWQKRLRLQDWDISIGYVGPEGLPNGSRQAGQNKFDTANGFAEILILDPRESTVPIPIFKNVEATLVHELLHMIITPLIKGKCTPQEELAIEKITKALLNL